MKRKSTMLRELLHAGQARNSIAVGTAHHAQLAQKTGHAVIGISGAMTSAHILGLPDAGFLTLTELVENVERICRAVDIPVTVDCDTGFGNAINVRRTVESVIRAGAAGLFIEDQVAPKRCGFVKGKELIPVEEAVGKYRAAVDVRNELDPDFVLMSRTDARGAVGGSLDEVLRRGEAYLKAGIDILYVEALQSREELRTVREAFPDAWLKATTMAIKPPLTAEEIESFGLVLVSCFPTQLGSMAIYDFLVEFKKHGADTMTQFFQGRQDHPLAGFGIFDLTGFAKVTEWERKYLDPAKLAAYDNSLGMYDPRSRGEAKPVKAAGD
jgi:2-methylisocitrate lyase-like PEP mutase family enzyme